MALLAVLTLTAASALLPLLEAGAEDSSPRNRFAEFGEIEVGGSWRTKNCWTAEMRGDFKNPYSEPIEGVRLVVRLLGSGEEMREVARIASDFKLTIPPGGSVYYDRKLETPCAASWTQMSVVAFAKRRGGAELPEPSRATEVEAAVLWR